MMSPPFGYFVKGYLSRFIINETKNKRNPFSFPPVGTVTCPSGITVCLCTLTHMELRVLGAGLGNALLAVILPNTMASPEGGLVLFSS